MKKYKVQITEYLQREVFVKASSPREAKRKVAVMYFNEEIVLSAEDFNNYDIEVIPDEE